MPTAFQKQRLTAASTLSLDITISSSPTSEAVIVLIPVAQAMGRERQGNDPPAMARVSWGTDAHQPESVPMAAVAQRPSIWGYSARKGIKCYCTRCLTLPCPNPNVIGSQHGLHISLLLMDRGCREEIAAVCVACQPGGHREAHGEEAR